MGFFRVDDIQIYLGMPLVHNRVTSRTLEFMTNKVRNKLNGWVASSLSLARGKLLAKSVLLSIPNYFMSTTRISIFVYKEIEKLPHNFIWGLTSEARKPALVAWENVCCPVESGGLEIRSLEMQNEIFLLKLGFQLLTNTDALWVQLLRNKYKVHGIVPKSINRSNCSYIWRSLMKV